MTWIIHDPSQDAELLKPENWYKDELASGDFELARDHDIRGVEIVHGAKRCAGEVCCIHNPSQHRLNDRPMAWRGDRGFMERICEHGIGHPDPDSVDFLEMYLLEERDVVHGCDGCCLEGTL